MQAKSQPTLRADSDPHKAGFVGVTVSGLDSRLMASLDKYTLAGGQLHSMLRVNVARAGARSGDNLPDIAGHYQIVKGGLRFIPHFPFERGLPYRASFDPRRLGLPEISEVLDLEFSLPKSLNTLPTKVQHIFPSGDCLPENLLRFCVGFSHSMQRGRAEAEIALLGPDGQPASDVLYRAPVELWDRKMRYLTILLDPGRLKRGVGPNRELGAPLKAGQEYRLAVGAGMLDLDGRRLTETVYKRFRVTEAVRQRIAVEQWKVAPPVSRSRDPLMLLFERPLDWASLAHTITVASSDGQSIDGRIMIDQCERRWSFTPPSPWEPGSYQVCITSSLEDVCGNSILAAFDRPLRTGSDLSYEVATRSIAFHLV
jgi:hypothetical protein